MSSVSNDGSSTQKKGLVSMRCSWSAKERSTVFWTSSRYLPSILFSLSFRLWTELNWKFTVELYMSMHCIIKWNKHKGIATWHHTGSNVVYQIQLIQCRWWGVRRKDRGWGIPTRRWLVYGKIVHQNTTIILTPTVTITTINVNYVIQNIHAIIHPYLITESIECCFE